MQVLRVVPRWASLARRRTMRCCGSCRGGRRWQDQGCGRRGRTSRVRSWAHHLARAPKQQQQRGGGGAAGDSHQEQRRRPQQSAESTGRLRRQGAADDSRAATSPPNRVSAGDAVDQPRGSKRAGDPYRASNATGPAGSWCQQEGHFEEESREEGREESCESGGRRRKLRCLGFCQEGGIAVTKPYSKFFGVLKSCMSNEFKIKLLAARSPPPLGG